MTVKRHITIDEIDDSIDIHSPTAIHVRPNEDMQPSEGEANTLTDFPEFSGDSSGQENLRSQPSVGHTFADLVIEFKNDYRAMAVILTILPMAAFVVKIDNLESLKYPLIFAAILNVLWFGLPPVVSLTKRQKKKT